MAKVLLKKERALLLHSEVIKQFPAIYKIIEENENITDELILKLPFDHQNFFNNMLKQVLKEAINEWKGDPRRIEDMGANPSKWKTCSLDNKPNRYIFYIQNVRNGKSLNVGSECIKHFWESLRSYYGGNSITQLTKNAGKLRLISELNEAIPGIQRVLNNWNNVVSNCEIILPKKLETPYLELGRRAIELFNDYLNEKPGSDYVEQFNCIIKKRNELINDINNYVKVNSSKKYVPNKDVRVWLIQRGQRDTIERLKDDGIITWKTAHRVSEPNFMKSLIPDIDKQLLNPLGLKVNGIDERRYGYVIEAQRSRLLLFSMHKDLLLEFSPAVFNENIDVEITLEKLISCCSLYSAAEIKKVQDFLTFKIGLSFEDAYMDDQVFILDISTGKYVIDNPFKFADRFKGLLLNAKNIKEEDLHEYLKTLHGKRYTFDEVEEIRESRKEFERQKRYSIQEP